jgi:hypothetical protein
VSTEFPGARRLKTALAAALDFAHEILIVVSRWGEWVTCDHVEKQGEQNGSGMDGREALPRSFVWGSLLRYIFSPL